MAAASRVALFVAICVGTGACEPGEGSPGASSDLDHGLAAGSTEEAAAEAFDPAPTQFGLQTFTVKAVSRFAGDSDQGLDDPAQQVELAMHVEEHGQRVGLVRVSRGLRRAREVYYWNGAQAFRQDLEDGSVTAVGTIRRETTQPPFLAVADTELLVGGHGYEYVGMDRVAGRTCERFRAPSSRHEFCRWRHMLLYSRFYDADGETRSATEVTEIVEGRGIPPSILALPKRHVGG